MLKENHLTEKGGAATDHLTEKDGLSQIGGSQLLQELQKGCAGSLMQWGAVLEFFWATWSSLHGSLVTV